MKIFYATCDTPLGLLMLATTDRGLCFAQFGEAENELIGLLEGEYPKARIVAMSDSMNPEFGQWMDALNPYLKGEGSMLDLPLDVQGTAFQIRVWRYLQSIPYGETRSYSGVAAAIGKYRSARAVARACASNRMALLIPCHRVIRGDGSLGGYRWGIERKQSLLEKERQRCLDDFLLSRRD